MPRPELGLGLQEDGVDVELETKKSRFVRTYALIVSIGAGFEKEGGEQFKRIQVHKISGFLY
jgi:hypothetical protein